MATTRQDAWTEEEDLLLAEVVLRHIREGGTQLSAFKEVGRQLSRTPAACGFRWNSCVRKVYKEKIEEAKQMRKANLSSNETEQKQEEKSAPFRTLDDVITFLQSYTNYGSEYEMKTLYERLETLQKQAEQLESENQRLLQKLVRYEEEYRTLFDYIDKKRSAVHLTEQEQEVELLRERTVLEQIEK